MIPDMLFPHINPPEISVSGEMMANVRAGYEQRLCDLVESSEQLMAALRAVRCLGLPSWCIGAGAIRSLVWDNLHGFQVPSNVDDVDVAYFDAEAPLALDAELQKRLQFLLPSLTWEVTNQARVHEWLAEAIGQVVSPLTSLDDGLATWPEFATCVGIYLDGDESLSVRTDRRTSLRYCAILLRCPIRRRTGSANPPACSRTAARPLPGVAPRGPGAPACRSSVSVGRR